MNHYDSCESEYDSWIWLRKSYRWKQAELKKDIVIHEILCFIEQSLPSYTCFGQGNIFHHSNAVPRYTAIAKSQKSLFTSVEQFRSHETWDHYVSIVFIKLSLFQCQQRIVQGVTKPWKTLSTQQICVNFKRNVRSSKFLVPEDSHGIVPWCLNDREHSWVEHQPYFVDCVLDLKGTESDAF